MQIIWEISLKKKERKKKDSGYEWRYKTTILIRISVEHITHHQSLEKSTENKKHDQKYCIFDGTCAHHVNFSKKTPNILFVQPHESFAAAITYILTRFRGNEPSYAQHFISSLPISFLLPVTGFLILLINYTKAALAGRFRGAELVRI